MELELAELKYIFSTQDALLGLTSLGGEAAAVPGEIGSGSNLRRMETNSGR